MKTALKKTLISVTAVILLFVPLICSICVLSPYRLVIANYKTGERYAVFTVRDGDVFGVSFIHSVNKSPVLDEYEIEGNVINAYKTTYSSFGAGVQTEISGSEVLSYDENGNMVITGFRKTFASGELTYIVGTVSDHILTIHNQTLSLSELCGKNAHVSFNLVKF